MYTEVIGRRLLAVWQKRTGEVVTPRSFFEDTYYPLFLAHNRLLQWINNSPFVRGSQADRAGQLTHLHKLLDGATAAGGAGLDASIAPGFPAAGTTATTAGQVSYAPNLWQGSADAGYCAWLGAAAGIGVSGGLCLALGEEEVLWAIIEGWSHYRAVLEARPQMKGNQVETWNGQWLAHRFGPDYDPARPLEGFAVDALLIQQASGWGLPTHSWVNVLLRLASQLPNTTAYVYSLGQTNRTLGFVPLYLEELKTLPELAHRLFKLDGTGERWPVLAEAYETRVGFARACESGAVGLVALEPANLRKAVAATLGPAKNPAQAIQQDIYQLWLTAMLNSNAPTITTAGYASSGPSGPEVEDLAKRLAEALQRYAAHEPGKKKGRGTTAFAQLVQQVFVPSVTPFINQLTVLLNATPAGPEYRDLFMEAVILTQQLSVARFALFQAVLKFRYTAG